MEKKKKKVCVVGIAYPPIMGDLPNLLKVVHDSLLDFRKENLLILGIKSLLPYQRLILPYQGLILSRNNGFGHWKSSDKYHLRTFRLRILFHNELLIRGRMVNWGT